MFSKQKLIALAGSLLVATAWAEQPELQDPTRPAVYQQGVTNAKQASITLKLQQIITRGAMRYAMIDGHLVKEGQSLGEYQVKTIESKRVVLENQDRTRLTLSLFNSMKY